MKENKDEQLVCKQLDGTVEKETYEELAQDREKLREQLKNSNKLVRVLEKSLITLNDELMSCKREQRAIEINSEVLEMFKKYFRITVSVEDWGNLLRVVDKDDYEKDGGVDATTLSLITDSEKNIIEEWLENE